MYIKLFLLSLTLAFSSNSPAENIRTNWREKNEESDLKEKELSNFSNEVLRDMKKMSYYAKRVKGTEINESNSKKEKTTEIRLLFI